MVALAEELKCGISGFNTTRSENILQKYRRNGEKGGLSGSDPDYQSNTTLGIAFIFKESAGRVPIIGYGGVDSPDEAMKKIRAGATWIGGVTRYRKDGPAYPGRIVRGLSELRRDDKEGRNSIREFIGVDANLLYAQIRRDNFSILL